MTVYWMAMPISALGVLMTPGVQGLMTRRVGPEEQGQLQGANQSLAGLASVLGPSLFGLSFALAVRHPQWGVPGLAHLIGAVVMSACVILGLKVVRDPAPS
jgi:DHA1 family tetracycline resistance protein-like MFS transporter